jgi:hypothetical protein
MAGNILSAKISLAKYFQFAVLVFFSGLHCDVSVSPHPAGGLVQGEN